MSWDRIGAGAIFVAITVLACLTTGCGAEPVSMVLTYEPDPNGIGAIGSPDMDKLVKSINDRLRGAGEARRADNNQIEVKLYGKLNQDEVEALKLRVGTFGQLEFRILADSRLADDRKIIEQAENLPQDQKEVSLDNETVAKWVSYPVEVGSRTGNIEVGLVTRGTGSQREVLVLADSFDVTGTYLTAAERANDQQDTRLFRSDSIAKVEEDSER